MPTFDSTDADCIIYVYREGIASAVGHDLAIEPTDFNVEIDEEAGEVEAWFAPDSLQVRHAMEDGQPRPGKLSARDKKKIERNIQKEVLETKRHRVITFRATDLSARAGAVQVEGVLSLHGVERPLEFEARFEGDQSVARVRIDQTDFGIEPYSALLGALKIKPEVDVEVRLPWRPSLD